MLNKANKYNLRITNLWDKHQTQILLFLIVLIGLTVRLLLTTGITASMTDGFAFVSLAHELLTGELSLLDERTYGFRFLMYIPIAVSIQLFGLNDFAVTLPGLLLSLTGIILAYKFALLIQNNESTALLCAFFLAVYPNDMIWSIAVTLDIPSSFFISLSLYFYLLASKDETEPFQRRKVHFYYFLTGLSFGIAYQIREMSIMLAVCFALLFLWDIWKKKNSMIHILLKYLVIFCGFLPVFIFELALTSIFTGGYPLFRYWRMFGIGWGPDIPPIPPPSEEKIARYLRIISFDRYVESIILPDWLVGYAFYLFVFSLIVIYMKRKENIYDHRKVLIILLWIFTILFYLQFGTSSPTTWRIFEKNTRFLASISIPMWSLIAIGLKELPSLCRDYSKKASNLKSTYVLDFGKIFVLLIIIVITFSNLVFAVERHSFMTEYPTEEVYVYLNTLPAKRTYVYPVKMTNNLKYYFRFNRDDIYTLSTNVANDSYVVIREDIWTETFPEEFESIAFSEWNLLEIINIRRQPFFPGGYTFNYDCYIFYVPSKTA